MSRFGDNRGRARLFALHRVAGAPDELTDEALVAASAVGDGAALGALFDRHSRAVARFASRLFELSNADLEDLVSATFLEASRSSRKFRGGSSVRTWLFGITLNVARHHVRGDMRRRALLAEYRHIPRADPPARPDDAAERRELVSRLEQVLASLPQELRVTFVMCDVEEVPCADAARVLGLREGAVWKRLYRARRALGSALQ